MSSSTSSFKLYLFVTLASLLLLLCIATSAVEWHLRRQAPPNINEDSYRQLVLHGTAPWIAVGDSHTANGLMTNEWLDNLGQHSDNIDSMLSKLEIRARRPGLKGVILSADAQMFAFYRLTADQGARVRELLDEHPSKLLFLRPQNRQYLASTVLAIASNPSVLWRATDSNVQVENIPVPDTPKWEKDAILRAQLHTPVREAHTITAGQRYRKTVVEIKKQGIEVCMVTYPLSSAYRRAAEKASTFAKARAFYAAVAAETDTRYVDASSIIPDRLFGDPDHLSPQGAAELTARLQHACAAGEGP